MYYSYVMGVGDEIHALSDSRFTIEKFGNKYGFAFPKENADEWERFISQYLELGY